MDLLKIILSAQNGNAVAEIAKKLNMNTTDAGNVIGKLAPVLGQGLARNAQSSGGLSSLLGALTSGQHQRYVDNPALAAEESGVAEGNKILGHLLGSKDASRQLASRASEATGVNDGQIKQMLPMLASLAMGALSKENDGSEAGLASGLGSLLDGDGDGSMLDDLAGLAGKFFKR